MRTFALVALSTWLLAAGSVQAQERKPLVVGVYLPSTLAEGASRFAFAEAFAKELGAATGRKGVARNFGRYEDFSKAAASGMLEVAVVEGWVVAQADFKHQALAVGVRSQDGGGRWAVVARSKTSLRDLKGKKLAVLKAPKSGEARFVSNAVFVGDLDVKKHFTLFPVPDVESAQKALEAKTVDAALMPLASVTKEMAVLYRTPKLPGALVVSLRGDPDVLGAAVAKLPAVAPFESFQPGRSEEVGALAQLVSKGPPKRHCVMAESPVVRVEPKALIRFNEVGKVMPAFTEFIAVPSGQPDE